MKVDSDFVELNGTALDPKDLRIPRARQVYAYLLSRVNPYVSFIGAIKADNNGVESIVIDVRVDRPGRVKNDIQYEERLAITFDPEDRSHPEVCALRKDFPRLPHTNLRSFEIPKSLCLYESTFEEIRHIWTPEAFIARIEDWLAKSALGLLHDTDQPLEPFLALDVPKIILPSSFFDADEKSSKFYEIRKIEVGSKFSLTARVMTEAKAAKDAEENKYLPMIGLAFLTLPVTHGVINRTPETFGDLCDLLKPSGFDLLSELRSRFRGWQQSNGLTKALLGSRLVIFLSIPHRRTNDATPEAIQHWAFVFHDANIRKLGEDIGVWTIAPGQKDAPGYNLIVDAEKTAAEHSIGILVPVSQLTPKAAAKMNGGADSSDLKCFLIGAGALGGYTALNLIKAGFGKWTLMDSDILLPHNSARHVLPSDRSGFSKAEMLAIEGIRLFPDVERVSHIHDDILNPTDPVAIVNALSDAEVIIDCTASVPAARVIERNYEEARARRVSVFLSPSGEDLVVLAEPINRGIRLDFLEMQYLRAVSQGEDLEGHLHKPDNRVRYARTCADVSSTIANDLVVLFSAIASNFIKELPRNPNASIRVWRCNRHNMAVQCIEIKSAQTIKLTDGGWTVATDEALISKLRERRAGKLPSETGGSLVGTFDLTTKTIYVVDSLPTPSDSVEDRTKFVRGESGNLDALKSVQERTAEQLIYIGEWHSHPRGSSTLPSSDDFNLLAALESKMHPAGLPAAMLIVGDDTLSLTCTTPGYSE